MLRTFERKARAENCRLISRARVGRCRTDAWLHPTGVQLNLSHSNEHVRALGICPGSVKRLILDENGLMDKEKLKKLSGLLKFTVFEVHNSIAVLALTFELKDIWVTTPNSEGVLVPNSSESGFLVVTHGLSIPDLKERGVLDLFESRESIELTPENIKQWLIERPQFLAYSDLFIRTIMSLEMRLKERELMQAALDDMAVNLGMEVEAIRAITPENIQEQLADLLEPEIEAAPSVPNPTIEPVIIHTSETDLPS